MNTQTKNNGPQVMNPDDAYAVVFNGVYQPAFFEKLAADYNIQPNNEHEAMEMLTMASQLRQLHDNDLEKKASASSSNLDVARNLLDQHLNSLGLGTAQPNRVQQSIKQAAARGAQHPELARAILSMQVAAQAQQATQ